jgi:hypothetical protein
VGVVLTIAHYATHLSLRLLAHTATAGRCHALMATLQQRIYAITVSKINALYGLLQMKRMDIKATINLDFVLTDILPNG